LDADGTEGDDGENSRGNSCLRSNQLSGSPTRQSVPAGSGSGGECTHPCRVFRSGSMQHD
jgi:hypothetical protein